jgi:hypothetical protein
MLDRMRWHVHTDVGAAVDAMLAGQHPGGQSRERAADGTILKYNYNPAIPSTRGGVGAKQQARSPLPDGAAAAGGGGGARSIVLSSVDDGEGALRTPPAGARGGGFVRRSVPVAGKEKGPVSGEAHARATNACAAAPPPPPPPRPQHAARAPARAFRHPCAAASDPLPRSPRPAAPACQCAGPCHPPVSSPPPPTPCPLDPGSIVTRRGRRVQLGTDSPEDALLRLHIADLDEERVWEVMTAMALHDKVGGAVVLWGVRVCVCVFCLCLCVLYVRVHVCLCGCVSKSACVRRRARA